MSKALVKKTDLIRQAFMGLVGGPALIAPRAAGRLQAMLKQMSDDDGEYRDFDMDAGWRSECAATFGLSAYGSDKDYDDPRPYLFSDGLAYIPIHGVLINRFNYCCWGYTGYDFIARLLGAAMEDPEVKGIVFDVNSYGGGVYGNFELAEQMALWRDDKPSLAVVNAVAFSGGYSLSTGASKIVCLPSGDVGSIGVVMVHQDMSKLLDDWGIKITVIHAGAHKVDGNPYEPLPKSVREEFQATVDESREAFVSLVAKNRGIEGSVVAGTEAAIYGSAEALRLGLIDGIATPVKAVADFYGELQGSNDVKFRRSSNMNDKTKTPGAAAATAAAAAAPAATEAAATPAAPAAAVTEAAATQDAAAIRTAERARVSGITGCEEAKGREALANHLAMNTETTVEAAKAMLAAAPEASANANTVLAAMEAAKHPNPGEAGITDGARAQADGSDIIAAYSAATGFKPATK